MRKYIDIIIKAIVISTLCITITFLFILNNKLKITNQNASELRNAVLYANSQPSYDFIKDSTVYMFRVVKTKDKVADGYAGTGIVIDIKDGFSYILTNRHVCDEASLGSCNVIVNDKFIKLEKVKVSSEENTDLSLWKTNANINKKKIKGIANGIGIGERGYSVGNFLGFKMMYTEGVYVGNYWESDVYNMNIAGGCSGSGVFNKEGYLVSIVFAGIGKISSPKALSVPTKNIKEFLNNAY